MNKKHIILFDMDGTLTEPREEFDKSYPEVYRRIREDSGFIGENLSITKGNIDKIDLNASRLINLDLQDLYNLTKLKLTCPRLNKIELIYYEHLNKLNKQRMSQ